MKKGILAVSFGTSHIDTMEKTIDVLEKEFAKTFEEAVVYRAFTSNMIIKKLKRTANIKVQTVGEALEKMAADGIEEVIVQPTHVINGIENDQMKADALSFRDRFSSPCSYPWHSRWGTGYRSRCSPVPHGGAAQKSGSPPDARPR